MSDLAGDNGELFGIGEVSEHFTTLHSGSTIQGLSLPPFCSSSTPAGGEILWRNADCDAMSVLKTAIAKREDSDDDDDIGFLECDSDSEERILDGVSDAIESDSEVGTEKPNPDAYVMITDNSETYPGYTRLRCPEADGDNPCLFGQSLSIAVVAKENNDFLSSSLMLKVFACTEDDNIFNADMFAKLLPMTRESVSEMLQKQHCGVTGPSLSWTNYDLVYGTMSDMQGDTVISIAHPSWPKEACDWLHRKRPSGWPSKDLIRKIASRGCHITSTAHKQSKDPDIEWRYSFSLAEVLLASSLNRTQKQCFVILKMLQTHLLDRPAKVLTSYHLKTVFFWLLERYPQDQCVPVAIGHLFLALLDEVLHSLIRHDIPNYFIPENNLLEHIHSDFIQDFVRKVAAIRKDPLRYLFQFNERYRFNFSPVVPLQVLFEPVLTLSSDATLEESCQAQTQSLTLFLAAYLRLERILTRAEATQQGEVDRLGQWDSVDSYFSSQTVASYFDYALLTKIIIQLAEEMVAVKGTLDEEIDYPSCLCFAAGHLPTLLSRQLLVFIMKTCVFDFTAFADTINSETGGPSLQWEIENTELEGLADEAFRPLIGQTGYASDKLEYGRFLCNIGRYSDGEKILLEIIQEKSLEDINFYSLTHLKSLDDHLERELHSMCYESDRPGVRFMEVSSLIHAGYILNKLYLHQDNAGRALAIAEELAELCEQVPSKQKAMSYSLLGYCFLMQDDKVKAGETFGKVLELQPDSELAEENCQQCMDVDCNE